MRAILLLLLGVVSLHAQAVIEAYGELPADAVDKNGDTIGGIGSGMVYDAGHDVYLCTTDRGPGDGTVPYRPRCVVLKISQTGDKLEPQILDSIIYRDEKGQPMTGLIPDDHDAATPRMKDGRTCIDPEAIACAPDGSLYVSEEYGPYLYHFRRDGRMLERFALPETYQPKTAEGKLDFSDSAPLVSGRAVNQGPEGMCLVPTQPSISTAALIFQSALVQTLRRGEHTTSLLFLDLLTGQTTAEFIYPFAEKIPGTAQTLDVTRLSVNDLAAVDDHRFLVLERDKLGRSGKKKFEPAAYKSVWLVDTRNAPPGSVLKKTFLFNLVSLVKDPAILNAKWESIAILPPHQPGEVTLMMGADNDFLNPVIHDDGADHPLDVKSPVASQFYKIRVPLPENP